MALFGNLANLRPFFKISTEVDINALMRMHEFLDHGITRQALSEELNAMSSKIMTQVRRHLASQTKMPYGYMVEHTSLRRSYAGNLESRIIIKEDRVPTLGRFMTSYTKRPKSWRRKGWKQTMRLRVWEGSIRFPKNPGAKPFVIDAGRSVPLIAVRTGKGRGIKVLSGPNIVGSEGHGEIERMETGRYIQFEAPAAFEDAVIKRIERLIAAARTK